MDIESLYGEIEDNDLTILATEHEELGYVEIAAKAKFILDCRNRVEPAAQVFTP